MALRVVGRAVPSSVNGTRRLSFAAGSRYSPCSHSHAHGTRCPHCTPRTRTLTRTPSLPHSLRPAPSRPLSEPPLDTANPLSPPPPASKPKRPLIMQDPDSDPFTPDPSPASNATKSSGSQGAHQQQQQGRLSPEKLQQRANEGASSSTGSRDYDGEREFTRASAQPSSKDHATPSSTPSTSSDSSSSPSPSPKSAAGSGPLDPPKGEMWSQKPQPKSPRPSHDSRSPEAGSVPTGAPTGSFPSSTSLSDGFGARDAAWLGGRSRAPDSSRPSGGASFPQFRAYSTSSGARAPQSQPPITDRPPQPRDPSQGPGPIPDHQPARGPPSEWDKQEPVPQRDKDKDIPRREPSGPSSPRPDEFIPIQTPSSGGIWDIPYRSFFQSARAASDNDLNIQKVPMGPSRKPPAPPADPTATKGPDDPSPAAGAPRSAQTPLKSSMPAPGAPIGQSRSETPSTRVPTPGKAPSRSVTSVTSSIIYRLSPTRSVHLACSSLPIRMFPRLCGPVAGEHHLVDASRNRVLQLYRDILKAGRSWQNTEEQHYIREEARILFRQNKGIVDPDEIQRKIFEGESRLALGMHYKIPYPRMYNVQPGTTMRTKRTKLQPVKGAYLDTLYEAPGANPQAR